MQCAHKVRPVQKDDGLCDVEIERKLLKCAMQIALGLLWRVPDRALGVRISRGKSEEDGPASEVERDVDLKVASVVSAVTPFKAYSRSCSSRTVEYGGALTFIA